MKKPTLSAYAREYASHLVYEGDIGFLRPVDVEGLEARIRESQLDPKAVRDKARADLYRRLAGR